MEKFHQLSPAARQRIRAWIELRAAEQAEQTSFDYDDWFHRVEVLRQQIYADPASQQPFTDVVTTLRNIRDGEDA